jgi:hypothetical protein
VLRESLRAPSEFTESLEASGYVTVPPEPS